MSSAEAVIATLRAHKAELRAAGIARLALFGSVARGEATDRSDIDLAAEFDESRELSLLDVVRIERELGDLLGGSVELIQESCLRPQDQSSIPAGSHPCLLGMPPKPLRTS